MKEDQKRLEKEKEENFDDVERHTDAELNFDKDEITRMRDMAKKLSQKMEQEKLIKFMKGPNSDSGSDSKSKANGSVKNTEDSLHRDSSAVNTPKHSKIKSSKASSQFSDRDRLKHFKIRKKPSSDVLNVEGIKDISESSRRNFTSMTDKDSENSRLDNEEPHKRKLETDPVNHSQKTDRASHRHDHASVEPVKKKSREEENKHKTDKLKKKKKKKHKRRDASK